MSFDSAKFRRDVEKATKELLEKMKRSLLTPSEAAQVKLKKDAKGFSFEGPEELIHKLAKKLRK
jgi:hypothetical protein